MSEERTDFMQRMAENEGTGDSTGSVEEVYGLDRVRVKSLTLEDMKNNFATPERAPIVAKGFMDHGDSCFPSCRDWSIPDIECSVESCVANYNSKCTMPSLIKIGANGKCGGCKKRKSGKKK